MPNHQSLTKDEELSLRALPCFQLSNIKGAQEQTFDEMIIECITHGLSHRNVKVTLKSNQGLTRSYFVKNIADRTTAKQQLSIAMLLSKQEIAPTVIYTDQNWFVTAFIDGEIVKNYSATLSEKYNILISQMVQFHENKPLANIELSRLSPLRVLNNLSSAATLTTAQQKVIDQIIVEFQLLTLNSTAGKQLTSQRKPVDRITNNLSFLNDVSVVCHGDFNFSNVLVVDNMDTQSAVKSYVIDYETACIAEPEYDVAMMLAVNAIDISEVQHLINLYRDYSQFNYVLSLEKITRYLVFSLIINGLWYLERFQKLHDTVYQKLAIEQFKLIEQLTEQRFSLPY